MGLLPRGKINTIKKVLTEQSYLVISLSSDFLETNKQKPKPGSIRKMNRSSGF